MKTALLALTMVGALAGTTLNTVAQDPHDDQVLQELREERATLAAELADLKSRLDSSMQERMRGEEQLHVLESELATATVDRQTIESEIHRLRRQLEESLVEQDRTSRRSDEMRRAVEDEVAAMERELARREMQMDRERAEMELDRARQELDLERALLERHRIERDATATQHPRSVTVPGESTPGSSGITIIMNGGDLHIHGSTDHVTVQPAGSR